MTYINHRAIVAASPPEWFIDHHTGALLFRYTRRWSDDHGRKEEELIECEVAVVRRRVVKQVGDGEDNTSS